MGTASGRHSGSLLSSMVAFASCRASWRLPETEQVLAGSPGPEKLRFCVRQGPEKRPFWKPF